MEYPCVYSFSQSTHLTHFWGPRRSIESWRNDAAKIYYSPEYLSPILARGRSQKTIRDGGPAIVIAADDRLLDSGPYRAGDFGQKLQSIHWVKVQPCGGRRSPTRSQSVEREAAETIGPAIGQVPGPKGHRRRSGGAAGPGGGVREWGRGRGGGEGGGS